MAGLSISPAVRRRVRQRASNRCEYCLYPQVACYAVFECDHVIPAAEGGLSSLNNLAWACPTCNASKGNRSRALDPKSASIVPLFNPRTDKWKHHFRWSRDKLHISGRTATGRATVRLLKMNRRG